MLVDGDRCKLNVKLVNPNGNRDETIKEIVHALDNLSSVSSSIFTTIRERLEEQRRQVSSISRRIDVASQQVTQVKGSQKLLRIVSPAKYPLENENSQIDGVASSILRPLVVKPTPEVSKKDMDHSELFHKRDTLPWKFEAPVKHPDDLLACYHIREPQLPPPTNGEVGLGKPPQGLDIVDSFLLFNTAENPYQHYRVVEKTQMVHSLGIQQQQRPFKREEQAVTEQVETPEAAKVPDDFYYNPSTLQIPDFDLPDCLPDLPGIVNDLDFSPLNTSSTPSFFAFSNSSQSQSSGTLEVPSSSKSLSSTGTGTGTPNSDQNQKPLPLPETPASDSPIKNQFGSNQQPALGIAMPPPPPPPPPMLMQLSGSDKDKDKPKAVASAPSSGGVGEEGRSNLMEAIRAAGGAGKASLRSAQERKYEAKKKRQEEKESQLTTESSNGSDLMADLKNSLAMRRKGISGIQTGPRQSAAVGDIMQKLASTIPVMEQGSGQSGFDDDESPDDTWDSD